MNYKNQILKQLTDGKYGYACVDLNRKNICLKKNTKNSLGNQRINSVTKQTAKTDKPINKKDLTNSHINHFAQIEQIVPIEQPEQNNIVNITEPVKLTDEVKSVVQMVDVPDDPKIVCYTNDNILENYLSQISIQMKKLDTAQQNTQNALDAINKLLLDLHIVKNRTVE